MHATERITLYVILDNNKKQILHQEIDKCSCQIAISDQNILTGNWMHNLHF